MELGTCRNARIWCMSTSRYIVMSTISLCNQVLVICTMMIFGTFFVDILWLSLYKCIAKRLWTCKSLFSQTTSRKLIRIRFLISKSIILYISIPINYSIFLNILSQFTQILTHTSLISHLYNFIKINMGIFTI